MTIGASDYCISFADVRTGARTYCIARQRVGEPYESFSARVVSAVKGRDYPIGDIRIGTLRAAKLDGHLPRNAEWGTFHYSY